MKIKIGDTVRPVSKCDTSKHKNGTIDLDCGHWCYFYQVKSVEP